ncbi:MAG: class F sortase [Candidatus Saccharibacteria bacterium]|nr:class F sortase [Candidatus Saccharibacteria bacterium]
MLKVNRSKKYLGRLLWLIPVVLLIGCLAKVAIWEQYYYQSKQGSPRASAASNDIIEINRVDETDVTPQQISEHSVPDQQPRYLAIEKIGLTKSRIIAVGTSSNGQLQSPSNIFDVGWYQYSGLPGQAGVAIYDGHNGGPTKIGVFKYLPNLQLGDIITIETGNGHKYHYQVHDNLTVPLAQADQYMSTAQASPIPGREALSIITCTGEWSQSQQTYLSRQFLRAVRI